jgi:hypothetical protein
MASFMVMQTLSMVCCKGVCSTISVVTFQLYHGKSTKQPKWVEFASSNKVTTLHKDTTCYSPSPAGDDSIKVITTFSINRILKIIGYRRLFPMHLIVSDKE